MLATVGLTRGGGGVAVTPGAGTLDSVDAGAGGLGAGVFGNGVVTTGCTRARGIEVFVDSGFFAAGALIAGGVEFDGVVGTRPAAGGVTTAGFDSGFFAPSLTAGGFDSGLFAGSLSAGGFAGMAAGGLGFADVAEVLAAGSVGFAGAADALTAGGFDVGGVAGTRAATGGVTTAGAGALREGAAASLPTV